MEYTSIRYVHEESGILHDKLSYTWTASCDADIAAFFAVSADAASTAQDFAVAAEGIISAASQDDAAVAIIVNPSPEPWCSDDACKLSTQ